MVFVISIKANYWLNLKTESFINMKVVQLYIDRVTKNIRLVLLILAGPIS